MLAETILFYSQNCTGCRACEVACGFHWTHQMDPSQSSIMIQRDDRLGRIEAEIRENCDRCPDKEIPLCIQVCSPRALSLGRKKI